MNDAAFSSQNQAEDVIQRVIDVHQDDNLSHLDPSDLLDYFEIQQTVEWINEGNFQRTALQFPDELLHVSARVFRALNDGLSGKELYVLADTSYGSCCVDEVAAQHVDADAIVHYGHACMSQTARTPVKYVFGKQPIDIDDCVAELSSIFLSDQTTSESTPESTTTSESRRRKIILKSDVSHVHLINTVLDRLRSTPTLQQAYDIVYIPPGLNGAPNFLEPPKPTSSSSSSNDEGGDVDETKTKEEEEEGAQPEIVFFVGKESITLTNVIMTNPTASVYSYSPTTRTARLETPHGNKLLMRRYAVVQKARDADVFGILVGTLGVASYLPLITHLRDTLRQAKKKFYTMSVGKLNPAKLANFMEIECWVLVACPETSFVEDSKDFLQPIVTPYELQLAMAKEGHNWTGEYILDFERVIERTRPRGSTKSAAVPADGSSTCPPPSGESLGGEGGEGGSGEGEGEGKAEAEAEGGDDESDSDDDKPQFSLITGKYRTKKRFGPDNAGSDGKSSAVIVRNKDGSLVSSSAGATYLQNMRTYKGLDPRLGQDEAGVLEQGREGIARGYGEVDGIERGEGASGGKGSGTQESN